MLKKTTLCYIEQDNQYLMLYRNKKKNDANHGKWIGIGGHMDAEETADECILREVKEETGLTLKKFQLCGKLYFYIDDLTEMSYLYKATEFEGNLMECDEGDLKWISKDDILGLNLWEGDSLFLKKLISEDSYFEMKLVYQNNKLVDYEVYER